MNASGLGHRLLGIDCYCRSHAIGRGPYANRPQHCINSNACRGGEDLTFATGLQVPYFIFKLLAACAMSVFKAPCQLSFICNLGDAGCCHRTRGAESRVQTAALSECNGRCSRQVASKAVRPCSRLHRSCCPLGPKAAAFGVHACATANACAVHGGGSPDAASAAVAAAVVSDSLMLHRPRRSSRRYYEQRPLIFIKWGVDETRAMAVPALSARCP
eukprot:TRINITY_DN422_c0_g1_i7.p1 TRINITY_DN422_c0_g1~~TRINITY_DN422_c0_g1_i7.p1  ORF type:complete len:216 (+),score=0.45 TRINITY_DN422_c0_g1_i7:178-825(+)